MRAPEIFSRYQLTRALWQLRREFMAAGFFSMVANLLMLTPTIYMLQVYDRVMMSQSMGTLAAVSLVTLLLFAVLTFSEWTRSRLLVRTSARMDELLSRQIFHASYAAYLSQDSGNPWHAFGEMTQLRQFLTGNGIFAFFDAPWAPIYIAVLFMLHPWLGAMAIGFALVQTALAWWASQASRPAQAEAMRAQQEAAGFLHSKLRNAEAIESMGMGKSLYRHWGERNDRSVAASLHAQDRAAAVVAWSKFIRYTQQSLALCGGALLVIRGELSPGAMIAANVLMSRALAPIDLLVSTWPTFLTAKEAFVRLRDLLESYPLRTPPPKNVVPHAEVTLKDVVASAPGRAEPILNGVSAVMPAGSVTVVLGASGSGKSTLARVMLGIWPQASGCVLLGGEPVSGWDRMELGPHVGYLPQDIELFDGTIAENIARSGRVEPGKVIEAANATGLHHMILRLPKGYDTPIGEAGSLLSAGQRQRIGLARALYGMPALVVLDEPNANLDEEGEAALQRAVLELKARGKTVVLISHRPGIVGVADRLLILHQGAVQASGPKDGVLAALQRHRSEQTSAGSPPLAPS
jgi:ATP-binding cassette subfamily C exporter for protease/lipase